MFTRCSRSARATLLAFALAGTLAACGGGGGGSTPAPSTPAPVVPGPVVPAPEAPGSSSTLTFTPATVKGTATAGQTAALSVAATVNKPADFANATMVFAEIIDTTGTIMPKVDITQPSPTIFNGVVHTAPTLAPGSYKGNFTVRVCRDTACAQHFPGSPMQLPFDITITAPAPVAVSAVPATPLTNLWVYSNLPAPAPVSVNVTAPGRTWTAATTSNWIQLANASGSGNGGFSVTFDKTKLDYGMRTGAIVLSASDGQKVELPIQLIYYIPSFTIDSGNLNFRAINGAPIPSQNLKVTLYQDSATWTAETDQPWLSMSPAAGTTPGVTTLHISPSNAQLASGQHLGRVTVSGPGHVTTQLPVTLDLTPATLSFNTDSVTLGGSHGRDFTTPTQLLMYLNTQQLSHPWKLSGMPTWATTSKAEGFASQTGDPFLISAVMANAPYGTTSAVVTATAKVNGDTVTVPLNLHINVDRRKLLFSEPGVGFSSTPNSSRLTRKITVKDNFGATPNWTVSSDQTWLTVTRAGNELTLTANPATLPQNATSFATVSLSSTDSGVTTPEPLRVALWKGSTTLTAMTKVNAQYQNLKADPIRPYVYANNAGSSIDVYNVYTAALERTISTVGGSLGQMAVSPSGDYLYVYDITNTAIIAVDLRTMTKSHSWTLINQVDKYAKLMAIRPNGVEVVLGAHGYAYLGATGRTVGRPNISGVMAATADGTRVYAQNEGLSPATVYAYSMDYSDMAGGAVFSAITQSAWSLGGAADGTDIAVSIDGSRLYTASQTPGQCSVVNAAALSFIGGLPGGNVFPNNVEVGSDGRVFCGIAAAYSTQDVWVHSAQGALLGGYRFAGVDKRLLAGSLVVSSDGMIMVGLTDDPSITFVPVGP